MARPCVSKEPFVSLFRRSGLAVTKQRIEDGIADAADAAKDVGKKAVEKVGDAADAVGEKGKDATQATGEAILKVGMKVRRQRE